MAAALLLVTVACGSSKKSNSASSAGTTAAGATGTTAASTNGATKLEDTVWSLVPGQNASALPNGIEVTALFSGNKLSGNSGCNGYSGAYVLNGSNLKISNNVASTTMACPPAQMAIETAYLAALPKVASYSVSGTQLSLKSSDGTVILSYIASGPSALTGNWTAIAYYSGNAITSVSTGSTLTAVFQTPNISGNGGCNDFNGPYVASATTIKIGPLSSTLKACSSDALNAQEQHYLAALQLATTYAVTSKTLDLFRADGGYAVQFQRA
jgi:heat shock protein HslJ